MNNKAVTLSAVMALLAVFFVQSYVESIENEAKKKFGTEVMVVKAKKDIAEQETINETHIELAPIPKRFLEPSAISFSQEEADNKEAAKVIRSLVGAVAVVPIREGEQIAYNKLTEPSIRTGLSPQIAPGRRAIAVPVSEVSGVSKLVKPGDRVDLVAVLDMGGGKQNKIAKTVLQDVVVLSVGRNVTNNVARLLEQDPYGNTPRVKSLTQDSSFTSVTLEVEPNQAQALALVMANNDNAITLSLRNNDDTERVGMEAVTFEDVLGAEAARLQRVPAGGRR